MENSNEVLLIEEALAMHSAMPMKQIHSAVICTKDYYFVIPTKSIGMFVIFNTIKDHSFFDGLSIPEGLRKTINEAENVSDLENKIKDLLENNDKYIFKLSEAKSVKIKSFLGKKTLMYRKPKSWASFGPKKKPDNQALVAFYPDL